MAEFNFTRNDNDKIALVLDQKDNVGTALFELNAGDTCTIVEDEGHKYKIKVNEDIPFGHKVALVDLPEHAGVYKYGEEIGKMKLAIKQGTWIHSHNMYCDRGLK